MLYLALLPFFLQASAMILDEGIFHLKRGLPKWERIGHPLDTLSTLACMLFVLFVPYSPSALKIYVALAIFSSIFVTKDEFVHKHHCPGAEQWLHAVLFSLHPVTLASAGLIWPIVQGADTPLWLSSWLSDPELLFDFLSVQASAMALFLIYQIVYWNFLWKGTAKKL